MTSTFSEHMAWEMSMHASFQPFVVMIDFSKLYRCWYVIEFGIIIGHSGILLLGQV